MKKHDHPLHGVGISLLIMLIIGIIGTCLMPARATAEQVTIGVVAPLTGPFAQLGHEMVQAAKDAVKVINDAGGLLGHEVSLVISDDSCNSQQGITVAKRLVVEKGVVAVIGHCPSVAPVVADFYEASNKLFISTSTGPGFFEGKPHGNVFYLGVREDPLAKAAADSISNRFIGRSIGIVRDRSPFNQRVASEMERELSARQMSVVFNEQILEPGTFVALLMIKKPDIIMFTTSDPSLILKLYRNEAPKESVVALGMPGTRDEPWDQFWKWAKEVGAKAYVFAPAAMGGWGPGITPSTPLKDIRILWQNRIRSGTPPTIAQVYVFTAFDLLAQAIAQTGSTDPSAIAFALRSVEKETLLGRLRSGETGEIREKTYGDVVKLFKYF
jgi:branched-chain amino acid transport system substrate-binding protein